MILDASITEAERRKCIVKLKNNKAAVADCIANEYINPLPPMVTFSSPFVYMEVYGEI